MKEKESATIGCIVALCGLVSPLCKFASNILGMLHNSNYNSTGSRGAKGREPRRRRTIATGGTTSRGGAVTLLGCSGCRGNAADLDDVKCSFESGVLTVIWFQRRGLMIRRLLRTLDT
ncbi:hypothetical protein TorRG33x02_040690 [Trema orientale]|uniref:Uncharacterized protein n=1 Tax=Trema orientale TaxID=63057 RepID=A0A2P5FRA1_TREOI|nr:hypothetical protein TorRG33x02_040690 [Trema orientale]